VAGSSLRALSQFYGTILAGAAGRLTTQALWSAVQTAAFEQTGSALSGTSIMDMNVLRGLAGSQLAAAAEFAGASTVQGITSSMWANEVDQRDWATRQIDPQFIVRFEHSYLDQNGDPQTEWRASVWNQLPLTKFELLDQLEEDAEGLSEKYGTTLVKVGSVMITSR